MLHEDCGLLHDEMCGAACRCPGRAAHFRARLSSGMRDAHDCEHKVPEGFSQSCMEALLSYVYRDTLADEMEPPAVVELLHAASYYGTPRCTPNRHTYQSCGRMP